MVKVKIHNIVTVKLCLGFHTSLNIGCVMPDQSKGSAEQIQVSTLIARTTTVIRHTIRAVFFHVCLVYHRLSIVRCDTGRKQVYQAFVAPVNCVK